MTQNTPWTIYTDGGSRGNPGPAAYAYIIQRPGESDIEEKAYLGRTTNNIAEYTGLTKALEHARHLGGTRLTVLSDSELMVRQMNGEYRVKHPGLIPLYEEAVRLCKEFDSVAIRHIRREFNKRADRLCNQAMDHPADNQPFPMPLPPLEKPATPPPTAEPPAPASPPSDVRQRAIEILAESARKWAQGDPESPPPEAVWGKLWRMLVEAKAVRSPRKPKRQSDDLPPEPR
jgi:ribonuclease HI